MCIRDREGCHNQGVDRVVIIEPKQLTAIFAPPRPSLPPPPLASLITATIVLDICRLSGSMLVNLSMMVAEI